jgi:hypothetical protein
MAAQSDNHHQLPKPSPSNSVKASYDVPGAIKLACENDVDAISKLSDIELHLGDKQG